MRLHHASSRILFIELSESLAVVYPFGDHDDHSEEDPEDCESDENLRDIEISIE